MHMALTPRRIVAGVSILVSISCGTSPTVPSADPIVGTFKVQSENGKPLPVTESASKTFVSGTLVANADRSLTFTMQFQESSGARTEIRPGNWSTTSTGYTLALGADLALPALHPAESHPATVSGNTMTITDAAVILVRQ